MTAAILSFDAARLGHRTRTRDELVAELVEGCISLAHLADAIERSDLAGDLEAATRTVEGVRRVLTELRVGGADHGA